MAPQAWRRQGKWPWGDWPRRRRRRIGRSSGRGGDRSWLGGRGGAGARLRGAALGDRPIVEPEPNHLSDVGREIMVEESHDARARLQQGGRLSRLALIDAIDDIELPVGDHHHRGAEPAAELIGQAVAILRGIGGVDPGVVDDIAMGGVSRIQVTRELAGDREGVGDFGAVDRGPADQQHDALGPGVGRRIDRAAIGNSRRRQLVDVEEIPMIGGGREQGLARNLQPLPGLQGLLADESFCRIRLAPIGGRALEEAHIQMMAMPDPHEIVDRRVDARRDGQHDDRRPQRTHRPVPLATPGLQTWPAPSPTR